VQPAGDLVGEHVAGPAVLEGGGGVPVPGGLVVELAQQHGDVAPRQSSNGLLDDRGLWPALGELPHIEQVAAGQSPHVRELGAQVGGEPGDYLRAPPLGLLALEDRLVRTRSART